MSADLKISELSANKMELERLSGNRKTVLNFVTPTNWRVGDTVAMQINRDPFYLRLVNGAVRDGIATGTAERMGPRILYALQRASER